jgi:hypothetical protein
MNLQRAGVVNIPASRRHREMMPQRRAKSTYFEEAYSSLT